MTDASDWPIVIVESPYQGDTEANRQYALRACADCLKRGEVPYASHLFFPQMLDELTPEQRELGLTAGYAFWDSAVKVVFYHDRGWSAGMDRAAKRALDKNIPQESRWLDPAPKSPVPIGAKK